MIIAWASWIRAVESEGTRNSRSFVSSRPARAPPSRPVSAMTLSPAVVAALAASRMFGLWPDVVKTINASFGLPRPLIWRAKT
ncbi:uncharacterized protein METZ01_LOCUS42624 [marine metagenome]|uniref:Uncharacterized protein n=1 Tax=marine metagenome TaxID=408172 RepID=A0A381RDM8_9ZZZZ